MSGKTKLSVMYWLAAILLMVVLLVAINWDAAGGTKDGSTDNKTDILAQLKKAFSGKKNSGTTATNSSKDTNVSIDYNKVLSKGSKGEEVKLLQQALNAAETTGQLTVDGAFGSLTEAKLYRLMGVKSGSLSALAAKTGISVGGGVPASSSNGKSYSAASIFNGLFS